MSLIISTASECVSERGQALCKEINGECITETDGYYIVSAICMLFGLFFLVAFIIPTARRLQGRRFSFHSFPGADYPQHSRPLCGA